MSFETPRAVALELVVWLDNDGTLYRERTIPTIKRLCEAIALRTYRRGAPDVGVRGLMVEAAKSYGREFRCDWRTTFPDDIRALAAELWLASFEAEYECNQHDGINPLGPSLRKPLPPKESV